MQDDKTLFTEKVPAGKRTYFFDVKENIQGSQILKITESRKNNGEFIRNSVVIFQEDFEKIFEAFQKVKQYIDENPSSVPNRVYPVGEAKESIVKPLAKEDDLSF